jgi:hypothetical protein
MPFDNFRLLVGRQLVKYFSKLAPQRAENPFLPSLRDEHHVILAVPSRVAQALILFHRESPSLGGDRKFALTVVKVKPW